MPSQAVLLTKSSSISKEKIAYQSGAVLPLLIILVALIFSLLLGITQILNASARENLMLETSIHSEMHAHFSEAIEFNALANNNLLMAEQLEKILSTLENFVSWGFNLAATTPLWEQKLPIPEKYNLFQRVNIALTPVIRKLNDLGELQLHHKNNLKLTPPGSIIQLNLLQSLCRLNCVRENSVSSSAAYCNSISFAPIDCQLTLNTPAFGALQLRRISIRSLLSDSFSQKKGWMLLDPNLILDSHTNSKAPQTPTRTPSEKTVRVGVVHPRLCAHPKNTFLTPCAQSLSSLSGQKSNLVSLSLEPHWSVAVEF